MLDATSTSVIVDRVADDAALIVAMIIISIVRAKLPMTAVRRCNRGVGSEIQVQA